MLYIQSALVGIATALIAIVISMITWMVIAANQLHHQFPHAEVGFDLRSMLALPSIIWLIGPLAFTDGFYPTPIRRFSECASGFLDSPEIALSGVSKKLVCR